MQYRFSNAAEIFKKQPNENMMIRRYKTLEDERWPMLSSADAVAMTASAHQIGGRFQGYFIHGLTPPGSPSTN